MSQRDDTRRVDKLTADLAAALADLRHVVAYGEEIRRERLSPVDRGRAEHATGHAAHHLQEQARRQAHADRLRRLTGG